MNKARIMINKGVTTWKGGKTERAPSGVRSGSSGLQVRDADAQICTPIQLHAACCVGRSPPEALRSTSESEFGYVRGSLHNRSARSFDPLRRYDRGIKLDVNEPEGSSGDITLTHENYTTRKKHHSTTPLILVVHQLCTKILQNNHYEYL